MFRRVILSLFTCLLLFIGWIGYSKYTSRSRNNIILIVLDTLRADHLSLYGYEKSTTPALDQLALESLWFSSAVSSSPWTSPSVASMFTGLYPSSHRVLSHSEDGQIVTSSVLSDGFEVLAESLSKQGYSTTGVTANSWIADYLGYNQGFDAFTMPPLASAAYLNQIALPFLKTYSQTDRPFFMYLHYLDPHAPYNAPKGFQNYFAGIEYSNTYSPKIQKKLRKYDAEIRSLDAALSHLFLELRQLGLWENTSIIIVGDHGEQFKEHGRLGHGYSVFPEETNVPLIIKSGKNVGRIDIPVSTIDVYATILDLAKITSPHEIQGVSLLTQRDVRKERGIMSEGTLEENYKAYVAPDGSRLVLQFSKDSTEMVTADDQIKVQLSPPFNRLNSPDEHKWISTLQSQFYDIHSHANSLRRPSAGEEALLTDETVEALKSLGYEF